MPRASLPWKEPGAFNESASPPRTSSVDTASKATAQRRLFSGPGYEHVAALSNAGEPACSGMPSPTAYAPIGGADADPHLAGGAPAARDAFFWPDLLVLRAAMTETFRPRGNHRGATPEVAC